VAREYGLPAALVDSAGDYSPENVARAGQAALTAEQRASGARSAQSADRMEASAAETARHNAAMEGNAAQTNARLAQAAASGGAAKTLSPTAESNIINRLSNQWMTASKPVRELDRAVSLMDTGIKAAEEGNLAQGAQAVLVTFQKILDPTSVVRETEYARSAEGLALLSRIQGAYERLASGGAGVPVSELKKFASLARQMADAQRSSVKAIQERIGKTADRYNIPRELVTDSATSATGGGGADGGGGKTPPADIADVADALRGSKDGTYEMSDGSKWKKRGTSITKVGG
jgi:hypothetical protein